MAVKRGIALLFLLCNVVSAFAADSIDACRNIKDPDERLKCYDNVESGKVSPQQTSDPSATPAEPRKKESRTGLFVSERELCADQVASMACRWELSDKLRGDAFSIRPHKPMYVTVGHSNDPNETPNSPTLGSFNARASGPNELKFQISFKTRILEWPGAKVKVWFGYTQLAHWQILAESRPFREFNHEPELMVVWNTESIKKYVSPIGLRFVNFGVVHQSNGTDGPSSRSWNRFYTQFGFQRDDSDIAVLIRPWWRFPEARDRDNNPDIVSYVGRGDLLINYAPRDETYSLSLLARNNLSTNINRGAFQFDVRFAPMKRYPNAKFFVQLFSGYGETLIDYNHRQTTLGIGISLADWM